MARPALRAARFFALEAAGKSVVAATRNAAPASNVRHTVQADFRSVEQLANVYRGANGVFVHLPIGTPDDQRTYAKNIGAALYQASCAHWRKQACRMRQWRRDSTSLLQIVESARSEGVLRYSLRADIPVSWAFHLDVADAVVALLDRNVTGLVAVGQHPAITGAELAEAFSMRLGRTVVYEGLSPEQFGASIAPLFGEAAAAGIAGLTRQSTPCLITALTSPIALNTASD